MNITSNETPQILKEFLEYLLVIKNLSSGTIKSYNYNLLLFFNFIKAYNNIETGIKNFNVNILLEITEADILAYLVYLNYYRDNSSKTRQIALGNIRSLYDWLCKIKPEFKDKENPTKYIPNITQSAHKNKCLTLEQAKKISNIFTSQNSRNPIRDNTIIFLFLNTGMRLSELTNLNIGNLDLKNKTIKVISKGNKEREIYINEETKKQILKYLNSSFKDDTKNINRPLFINYKGKRLGISNIKEICKKAYKLAGLEEQEYTVHTLRHTAASIMYEYVTQDINIIKNFLGHDSIEGTQIYIHISEKTIKNAFYSNPLSNLTFERSKRI